MRILIVDDNPQVRQLLRNCLADLAAEFLECSDGLEAVAVAVERQPDWVLMDLKMPRLDGISAARRILDGRPQTRVVIVTQFEGAQLRQAALEAGAAGYVLKDNLLALRDFFAGGPPGSGVNPPPAQNSTSPSAAAFRTGPQ